MNTTEPAGFLFLLTSPAVDGYAILLPIFDDAECQDLIGTGRLYFLPGGLPAEMIVQHWTI
jgi:hypothetical protein